MPITLPPLSRRRFLASSLATAAGAVAGSQAWAEGSSAAVENWALLSDPHISENRGEVHLNAKMAENLFRVIGEVTKESPRPGNLLVNGDLAFLQGKSTDYATFIELLKPVREAGVPVHLTLGNHDNRERFWQAIPNEKPKSPAVADRQLGIVSTPLANWFLLDTLIETQKTPGELGEAQRKWLAESLDAHADKPAIVMMHHNPVPLPSMPGLIDTQALLEILLPRKHVKAYIFGHTHHWVATQDSGLHLVNLPPVGYVFNAKDPNGWVRWTMRADGATAELRSLDTKHPQHGQKLEIAWRT